VVPQRQINLTEENPSLSIGRASKVPAKGFVAAHENAWFESPVMSRQHAELNVNFDTKVSLLPLYQVNVIEKARVLTTLHQTLSIKDIGSLHGTFHTGVDSLGKEDRLRTNEPIKLADGDRVRFGTDIYRAHDTFPPCTVHVSVKWNQPYVAKTITPPKKKLPTNNTP
jgi:pSer/pThr/pTyr-binding forkhead associated (FHA) protein